MVLSSQSLQRRHLCVYTSHTEWAPWGAHPLAGIVPGSDFLQACPMAISILNADRGTAGIR